ncbi:hypothetical protein [Xanthobacter flavus]|uniref:hypothetical protein n=1 Tax=Xanthobacter flavus TaxID=281 RepID=UPI0037274813
MANAQDWVTTDGLKALEGTFDGVGQSLDFPLIDGWANVTLWTANNAVFDAQLEKTFGGGVYHPIKIAGTQLYRWTAPAAERFSDPETGVRVRLNVTALSSGTLKWRISR